MLNLQLSAHHLVKMEDNALGQTLVAVLVAGLVPTVKNVSETLRYDLYAVICWENYNNITDILLSTHKSDFCTNFSL